MVKYADNWGGLTPENKKFIDEMYKRYVPMCGKADTVGGEIVRAINRICYKYYNDGDTVCHYYSSEYNHSWACDSFLVERVYGYRCMKFVDEYDFEDRLAFNFNYIAEFLKTHNELFEIPNETDCLDDAPLQQWDEDDEYEYEDEWGN